MTRRPQCQADCGRPSGSGFLCTHCLATLRTDLEAIPDLLAELQLVITRQAVYGTRYGSRSTSSALPYGYEPSGILTDLEKTLTYWAKQLIADSCPVSPKAADIAAWMIGNLNRIRNHYQAGKILHDICGCVEQAQQIIDRPADSWYAGPCGTCHRHMYATISRGRFNCYNCGRIHNVSDLRDSMLKEAENYLATAATAAKAIAWLAGVEVTSNRIHMWVKRRRLVPRGSEPYATPADPARTRPLYRIGDVLDLLVEDLRATPSSPKTRTPDQV